MDEEGYRAWLHENWAFARFADFCERNGHTDAARAYEPRELAALGRAYGELDRRSIGLPPSLADYWGILTYPAFGPGFWTNSVKVGLFFKEFPLPRWDDAIQRSRCPRGCDLYFGQKPLPSDIMAQELAHVSHGHTGYTTLIRGLGSAGELLRILFGIDTVHVPEGVVVSDIVKRFAPFDGGGRPFNTRLTKQSAHRAEMYRFAAALFIEEITEHLGLQYVFLFGLAGPLQEMCRRAEAQAGWCIYQPAGGKGRPSPARFPRPKQPTQDGQRWIVLLPHPQAWGHALKRVIEHLKAELAPLNPSPNSFHDVT